MKEGEDDTKVLGEIDPGNTPGHDDEQACWAV